MAWNSTAGLMLTAIRRFGNRFGNPRYSRFGNLRYAFCTHFGKSADASSSFLLSLDLPSSLPFSNSFEAGNRPSDGGIENYYEHFNFLCLLDSRIEKAVRSEIIENLDCLRPMVAELGLFSPGTVAGLLFAHFQPHHPHQRLVCGDAFRPRLRLGHTFKPLLFPGFQWPPRCPPPVHRGELGGIQAHRIGSRSVIFPLKSKASPIINKQNFMKHTQHTRKFLLTSALTATLLLPNLGLKRL